MRRQRKRSLPPRFAGTAVAAAAGVLAIAMAPLVDVQKPERFAAFIGLAIVGELFEIKLGRGASSSLGLAPPLGYMLVLNHVPTVLTSYAAGGIASIVIRRMRGGHHTEQEAATRLIVLAFAAGTYAQVRSADPFPSFGRESISTLGLIEMLAVVLIGSALIGALVTGARERIPWFPLAWSTLRTSAPLNLSVVSVGALLGLAYPVLGVWSVPLFLAPLLATQYSFRQLQSIQSTYMQTIRALSKVPEMAGYTRHGHSARVAEISVAIARELGVHDIDEIEYAALLHDIGRVSIVDPSDESTPLNRLELAEVGANIIGETRHMPDVAHMIRRQYDPYRRRGEDVDRELPMASKIVKVASAYDDMVRPDSIGLSSWDALENLHSAMAYDYDPSVITALTRVLEKRGEI